MIWMMTPFSVATMATAVMTTGEAPVMWPKTKLSGAREAASWSRGTDRTAATAAVFFVLYGAILGTEYERDLPRNHPSCGYATAGGQLVP